MAKYMFICKACGLTYEVTASPTTGPGEPYCVNHEELVALTRDYQAEGVAMGNLQDLKHDREMGTSNNAARLFLPTNKDFAGPGDPDGKSGMREWREKHRPRPSNKKPYWPGDVEKRVF